MRSNDERRFAWALCFSLAAHVLVLSQVKGFDRERRPSAGAAFTVAFIPRPDAVEVRHKPRTVTATPATPAVTAPATTVLLQPKVAKPSAPVPAPKPTPGPAPAGGKPPPDFRASSSGSRNGQVRPDAARRPAGRGAGVVEVLMVIGPDGHPKGIHWDKLPALTDAQLGELESLIRRQVYPSMEGARLTQEIDVFDLLAISRRVSGAVGEQTAE